MICQANYDTSLHYPVDGIFSLSTGLLVNNVEDVAQRQSPCLCYAPPGQLTGDGIHEFHFAFSIRGDNSIADAREGDLEPQQLFPLRVLRSPPPYYLTFKTAQCPPLQVEKKRGRQADEDEPDDGNSIVTSCHRE